MRSLHILLLCAFPFIILAQVDPDAMKLLDEVAEKMINTEAWEIKFKYTLTNQKDNSSHEQEGSIKLKGNKYILDMLGNTIYFDGEKNYNYIKEANEVMIMFPEEGTEELFFTKPSKLFTFHKEGYKSRLNDDIVMNKKKLHSVDLFPMDLEQSFFKINILIKPEEKMVHSFKVFNKDGIQYEIILNSIEAIEIPDVDFTFDPKKHPKVEIVDLTE